MYSVILLLFTIRADGYMAPLPMSGYMKTMIECEAAAPGVVESVEKDTGIDYGWTCIDSGIIHTAPSKAL